MAIKSMVLAWQNKKCNNEKIAPLILVNLHLQHFLFQTYIHLTAIAIWTQLNVVEVNFTLGNRSQPLHFTGKPSDQPSTSSKDFRPTWILLLPVESLTWGWRVRVKIHCLSLWNGLHQEITMIKEEVSTFFLVSILICGAMTSREFLS